MNNFDHYVCCMYMRLRYVYTHDDFTNCGNITYTLPPLLLSWFRFCSESSVSQTTPRNSHYMKSTVETVSGSNFKGTPHRSLPWTLTFPTPPISSAEQFDILYSCIYTHHCHTLCVTALLLSPFNTTLHTHTPPPSQVADYLRRTFLCRWFWRGAVSTETASWCWETIRTVPYSGTPSPSLSYTTSSRYCREKRRSMLIR